MSTYCSGLRRVDVYLRVKHNFRSSVPSRGHVLREKARVIVLRVRDPRQTEVADFKVTGGIQQQIARLQVSVQHVRRVYILQPPQYLVQKITYVVVANGLCTNKREISFDFRPGKKNSASPSLAKSNVRCSYLCLQ